MDATVLVEAKQAKRDTAFTLLNPRDWCVAPPTG